MSAQCPFGRSLSEWLWLRCSFPIDYLGDFGDGHCVDRIQFGDDTTDWTKDEYGTIAFQGFKRFSDHKSSSFVIFSVSSRFCIFWCSSDSISIFRSRRSWVNPSNSKHVLLPPIFRVMSKRDTLSPRWNSRVHPTLLILLQMNNCRWIQKKKFRADFHLRTLYISKSNHIFNVQTANRWHGQRVRT